MGTAKGRRGKSSEVDYEAEFCKILDELGIGHEKMEDPLRAGFPDRYLGRGLWIEFKRMMYNSTPKNAVGRPRSLDKLMRMSQRRRIPRLVRMGDTVLTGIFLLDTQGTPARLWLGDYSRIATLADDQAVKEAVLFARTSKDSVEGIGGILNGYRAIQRRSG